jgi:hypothetical protein
MTKSEKAMTVKSKYFVSNLFVEKIFDTMTVSYKNQIDELRSVVNKTTKEVNLQTK